ncbi:MAG: carbohydrate-binding family 9-like protein [Lachnospiraceae bacterium]|nr:carbohydrate-binding family 9-like protein [Lachnospiraceae bacterium]
MIDTEKELALCEALSVSDYLWNSRVKPDMEVKMAVVRGYGLAIDFLVKEKDPKRVYTQYNDPVYKDSAVEFFINPEPNVSEKYINLEINANGAFLCRFGVARAKRTNFDELTDTSIEIKTEILDSEWAAHVKIPNRVFKDLANKDGFERGDRVTFNLYKISESEEIEHYGAFSHIDSPTPNFHLPEFFAEGIIM